MKKNIILSIQSKVVYGYVGNNIADFAIQLQGFDVISFPTVYLAAHTGHKPIYGSAIDPTLFADFIKGINNLDVIKDVPCGITGYIGSMPILKMVSEYMGKIKQTYPDFVYVCDPVMGDVDTGLYVSKEVSDHIEFTLLPECDVMTPNFFEFEYLAKTKISTQEDIQKAVTKSKLLQEKAIVITSCMLEDTPSHLLETIIVQDGKIERICTEKIAIETTGTGDFFASLLTTQLAKGVDLKSAVEYASQTVSKALKQVLKNNNVELNAESVLFSIFGDKEN